MVLPGIRCFFLCLVNLWQRHTTVCSVCYERGTFLSLFVYIANVCSCKVCVCLCFASTEKVSISVIIL